MERGREGGMNGWIHEQYCRDKKYVYVCTVLKHLMNFILSYLSEAPPT